MTEPTQDEINSVNARRMSKAIGALLFLAFVQFGATAWNLASWRALGFMVTLILTFLAFMLSLFFFWLAKKGTLDTISQKDR